MDATRPARTARRFILTLCWLTAAIVVYASFTVRVWPHQGALGWVVDNVQTSSILVIRQVVRNYPFANAGIAAGDYLDFRDYTPLQRAPLIAGVFTGTRYSLAVHRGARIRHVMVTTVPAPQNVSWDNWLATIGALWTLLFAGVIASRRADAREARLVSLVLITTVASLWGSRVITTWPLFTYVWAYVIGGGIANALSLVLFACMAVQFADAVPKTLRLLLYASYAAIGVSALIGLAWALGSLTLWPDPYGWLSFASIPNKVLSVLVPLLAIVGCGAGGILAAHGLRRQRASWIVLPLGAYLFLLWVFGTVTAFLSAWSWQLSALQLVLNIAQLVLPVVLTYALLSRRIIDIGYVLNSAAVFTGVSVVVVAVFVLVEWLLGTWFTDASRTTSIALNAAVALILGVSLRFIFRRIERTVDIILFRKRYEAVKGLLHFAEEAAFINNRDVLLQRTASEVRARTDAAGAGVLLARQGRPCKFVAGDFTGAIHEDDEALVAMRARHAPVHLHEVRTALPGECAFPMVARGEVIGALVCGPKRMGLAFAPDEFDALAALARGVGQALYAMPGADRNVSEQILEKLSAIHATLLEVISR